MLVSVVFDRDFKPIEGLPTFYTSACSSSLHPQARRSRLRFQNKKRESVKLRLHRKRCKMSSLRIVNRREGFIDKRDSFV